MIYFVEVEFKNDFFSVSENRIKIGIKTRPIKGKANEEIIKKIAKHFGVSSTNVQIRKGHRSQQKIIEILENDPAKNL